MKNVPRIRKWMLAVALLPLLAYDMKLFAYGVMAVALIWTVAAFVVRNAISPKNTDSESNTTCERPGRLRLGLGSALAWMAVGCAGLAIVRYFHTDYRIKAVVQVELADVQWSPLKNVILPNDPRRRFNFASNTYAGAKKSHPLKGSTDITCTLINDMNEVELLTACKSYNVRKKMQELSDEIEALKARNDDLEFGGVRIERTTITSFSPARTVMMSDSTDPDFQNRMLLKHWTDRIAYARTE